MRPYILSENNWKDVLVQPYRTALLPYGATEAHNLHLPYGTDTMLAQHIAADAAKYAWEHGAKSIVLPAMAYGVNSGQMEVKLCMNVHPSTQLALLDNIVEVLQKAGIPRLIIINAHGGNNFQPTIRELSVKYPNMMLATLNWWMAVNASAYFGQPGDHAGELETSAMQAIHPELVLPLEFAGKGTERLLKAKGFREKWAWTPRRWILVTKDTGVGDPSGANATQGEKFIKASAEKIGDFIIDFSKADKEEELYE
ncbi:MAG: creatininase family protein [Prevotellaceae bacterium]|jgi:creatinine amidohydrolase|nr:creatininase family protein [Prevotellaceae bacterium]